MIKQQEASRMYINQSIGVHTCDRLTQLAYEIIGPWSADSSQPDVEPDTETHTRTSYKRNNGVPLPKLESLRAKHKRAIGTHYRAGECTGPGPGEGTSLPSAIASLPLLCLT